MPQSVRREQSLLLNVSTLLSEGIGSTRAYEIVDAPFVFNGLETPVNGAVSLLRTDGSVMATASFRLQSEELCGACTEAYVTELAVAFEEEYWPQLDPVTQRPVEVPEEREGFPIVDSHIDLGEAVRQYAEIARPLSPRCGDACPGLPADPEATPEGSIDSRWAALQGLRDELD